MEFDTSSFREDFPFLSSLFSDNNNNNSNPTLKHEFGNGFSPFADGSGSSKGFHNFILPDHNQNSSTHHFHQISVEGSSKNPFSGVNSSTCTDSFEPYSGGFSTDLNAYIPALPFAPPDHGAVKNNGPFLQGFQSEGCWDFSQDKGSADLPETDQSFHQLLNFQDQQPPAVSAKVADEVSCVTADQNGCGDERKNNQTRRGSKAVEKPNIIKGQWNPQEDRYNTPTQIFFLFILLYFCRCFA